MAAHANVTPEHPHPRDPLLRLRVAAARPQVFGDAREACHEERVVRDARRVLGVGGAGDALPLAALGVEPGYRVHLANARVRDALLAVDGDAARVLVNEHDDLPRLPTVRVNPLLDSLQFVLLGPDVDVASPSGTRSGDFLMRAGETDVSEF